MNYKLLFACGGTAGHINPALAVAGLARERNPETEILFVGADGGMECDLVPRAGYDIRTIPVISLRHSIRPSAFFHNSRVLWRVTVSLRAARRILREFQPDAVLGTGGYASYPILREAARMGFPTAVHESNALPGLTTRLLAGRADRVLVGFAEVQKAYRDTQRVVQTGTPVHQSFFLTDRDEARAALGLRSDIPVVVSYFGSRGARDMNRFMVDFIAMAAREKAFTHIHACGRSCWDWMPDAVEKAGVSLAENSDIRLLEYIYDMPVFMAAADLLITRAGASTLAELMAAGRPAILTPSPNVTGNHQEKNALALSEHGAAVLLREEECSGNALFALASRLLVDKFRLAAMETALREMAEPNAAEKIYSILMEIKK